MRQGLKRLSGVLNGRRDELNLLLLASVYFGVLVAPFLTWVNTGCDGAVYLRSAKYTVVSHATGAPLFNMLNWFVVRIPIGGEAWRLAMVSAIAAVITTILVYKLAKRLTDGHWAAWLAPAVWMASTLVVSQATIIETYSLVTMLGVAVFYCHETQHDTLKYVLGAAGIGIHHLIAFPLLVVLVHDIVRYRWRWRYLLLLLGIVPYAWVVLVNRPPFLWIGGTGIESYIDYFFGQGGLIAGLAILEADALLRLQDFVMLLPLTYGVAMILAIPAMFKRENVMLTLLAVLPLMYYLTDLAPQTYVYMLISVPFAALLAVRGAQVCIERVTWSWAPGMALIVCIGLMLGNVGMMDIGHSQGADSDRQAVTYYESLSELPRGATLWIYHGGWWRAVTYLYSDDNGADLQVLPIFGWGTEQNVAVAQEALENGSLYELTITDERHHAGIFTLRTDLEGLRDSVALVTPLDTGEDVALHFGWVSPYDLLRGDYEMERWAEATTSNINAGLLLFFAGMAVGGGVIGEKLGARLMKRLKRALTTVQLRAWSFAGAGAGIGLAMVLSVVMGMQLG